MSQTKTLSEKRLYKIPDSFGDFWMPILGGCKTPNGQPFEEIYSCKGRGGGDVSIVNYVTCPWPYLDSINVHCIGD